MTNSTWEDLRVVIGVEILPTRLMDLPPSATNGLGIVIERDGLHGTRSGSGAYYFEPFDPDAMEIENLGETAVVQYLDLCVRSFLKQITGPHPVPVPAPGPDPVQVQAQATSAEPFVFPPHVLQTLFKDY